MDIEDCIDYCSNMINADEARAELATLKQQINICRMALKGVWDVCSHDHWPDVRSALQCIGELSADSDAAQQAHEAESLSVRCPECGGVVGRHHVLCPLA